MRAKNGRRHDPPSKNQQAVFPLGANLLDRSPDRLGDNVFNSSTECQIEREIKDSASQVHHETRANSGLRRAADRWIQNRRVV